MHSSLLKRAAGVGLALTLIPSTVFGATSQSLLNAGLATLASYPSTSVMGTININVSERSWTKDHTPVKGNIAVHFNYRELRHSGTPDNSEGAIVLDKISFSSNDQAASLVDALESMQLTQPIEIDWKTVDKVFYLRINSLPQGMIDTAAGLGIDLTPFINVWLNFDLSQFEATLQKQQAMGSAILLDAKKLSAFKDPLLVVRLQSSSTNAKGEKIDRMLVRVNPLLLAQARAAELKALNRKTKDYWTQVKDVNMRYTKTRTQLNGFKIIAVVNESTQALERIELGGQQTQPKQTCIWNDRLEKDLCKNTYTQTAQIAFGMNFAKDSDTPIIAPAPSVAFTDLVKQIEDAKASSTEMLPPDASSTLMQ